MKNIKNEANTPTCPPFKICTNCPNNKNGGSLCNVYLYPFLNYYKNKIFIYIIHRQPPFI